MKRVLLLFIIVSAISCTKEKNSASLIGRWNLVEVNAGIGYGFITTNYTPGSELTIQFKANGDLVLFGPNPGTAYSPLWYFTKYELLPDNGIRFFDPATSAEMVGGYTVSSGLSIWYTTRCGYEEKFIRH